MNLGHNKMALWCLENCVRPNGNEDVLDIGCGGGQNIANLLKRTTGCVHGIDYSAQSVAKSLAKNKNAVREGRTKLSEATVSDLPYGADSFDLVTAFETIYFWPDIVADFKEVSRVLRPGGRFVVCNEVTTEEGNERWVSILDMRVYSSQEIADNMTKAGFSNISVQTKGRNLCVIGCK